MPVLLARSAQCLALVVAAALGVIGALALRAPGLITVLVAAALVGAVAAGMVCDAAPVRGRGSSLDTGSRAAGWTAGALLLLSGLAALAGAVVTVLVAGAVLVGAVLVQVRRATALTRPATRPVPPVRSDGPTLLRPSVGGLSSRALGEEWLRTTALLEAGIDPVLRRAVVARRESILDELERRDGVGFARWLADVPAPCGNPAEHVRDLPAAGTGAA